MQLDDEAAWIKGVTHCPSPNHNARPKGHNIDLIVIHCISLPPKEFGGPFITDLFLNQLNKASHPTFENIAHLEVSAHVLIRRTGEVIQYVSLQDRAWHAGVSCFNGREKCNDFSIGIELEGYDDILYTDIQYQQLASLIKLLQQHWPHLNRNQIVGHSDIAPERKTDPGPAFDWQKLWQLLEKGGR